VQPEHLDDLVEAVVRGIGDPAAAGATLAAIGPAALRLQDYLAAPHHALGFGRPALVGPVPPQWALAAAQVVGMLPNSALGADAVRMLLRGNTADTAGFSALLGRAPRAVAAFVAPDNRPGLPAGRAAEPLDAAHATQRGTGVAARSCSSSRATTH
jgi:hypothetical protein